MDNKDDKKDDKKHNPDYIENAGYIENADLHSDTDADNIEKVKGLLGGVVDNTSLNESVNSLTDDTLHNVSIRAKEVLNTPEISSMIPPNFLQGNSPFIHKILDDVIDGMKGLRNDASNSSEPVDMISNMMKMALSIASKIKMDPAYGTNVDNVQKPTDNDEPPSLSDDESCHHPTLNVMKNYHVKMLMIHLLLILNRIAHIHQIE